MFAVYKKLKKVLKWLVLQVIMEALN
jgi:hypothetical protein